MATKKSTTRIPRKRRAPSAKSEAERERLGTLIEANEERLARGQAANGTALTAHQQETLRAVLKSQQDKLAELNDAL
jgi:hypothetical protein